MRLNVYLNFPGTCAEAIRFYHGILGGEISAMMPYEGSPAADGTPDEWKSKIMHATLSVGGMNLMASDTPPEQFATPQGYHVSIQTEDPAEGQRLFAALSEGGQIVMPFEPTFWAKGFGMLTDRFGINWMVNCS